MVLESQTLVAKANMQETLHGLLESAAAKRGDHLCIKTCGHQGYTYKEFLARVTRCASHLALLEADVLLLVAERSYGLVLCLLSTLKAGKAYCPIEPDYPAKRIAAMLETAQIRHALLPAQQHPQLALAEFPWLHVVTANDDGQVTNALNGNVLPADLGKVPTVSDKDAAYVLFTSGSTGKPKGCQVPHRGSALYAKSVVEACGLSEDMTFVLKTPYVFDVHVQDLFSALAASATIVIADPGAHKDAENVVEMIVQEKINVACFVPTLLVEFVNYLTDYPSQALLVQAHLKRVLTIGEALMATTCKQLFELVPAVEIHNLYGPTEASVGVSHFHASAESLGSSTVAAIGKPFGYVNFRVFDPSKYEDKQITADLLVDVPEGETGELFLGGDCLAHGYINDPQKTGAAFFDFPGIQSKPGTAASPFTLYKTGDLVRKRLEDGIFEYLGRCDFQVKIGGVRIECEEVSSVLMSHPAVNDALVTCFDGPYGKALVAYVVVPSEVDWEAVYPLESEDSGSTEAPEAEEDVDLVSKWGAVYDEMYQDSGDGVAENDPTLNWSGYVDTYSRRTHVQPVIQEWVEWSCEQVLRYKDLFNGSPRKSSKPCCVTELGCGNGMLLFRIAPTVTATAGGKYIGTDISTTALKYIENIRTKDGPYKNMAIDTKQIAAHEILNVCERESNDVVLCNGVTMYFPSATYLLECMKTAVDATADGGYAVFGDVQSKRHVLFFHAEVQAFQALRRPDATATAVLAATRQAAASEGLSYFDDALFDLIDRQSAKIFNGRVARLDVRLKRGWWHSEFSRFRYDVELVVDPELCTSAGKSLSFQRRSYEQVCTALGLDSMVEELSVPAQPLAAWVQAELAKVSESDDGVVITLPNARTLRSVRLLEWLEKAAVEGRTLSDLPHWLRPLDVELGGSETPERAKYGVEPEALFIMQLPNGWTQRVIWSEDPAMLELVLLRDGAANGRWLSAVHTNTTSVQLSGESLDAFKNNPADFVEDVVVDPATACHKALRAWTAQTSLLPAMRPMVYVAMDEFPKNQAGKTDRGKLPDARQVLDKVSDAAALAFEEPETEDEIKMARCWKEVVKVPVSASTPFLAYGGNSLTALQLTSRINDAFGIRPDFAFLTSEDCTVRELLRRIQSGKDDLRDEHRVGCIVRLSPVKSTGLPLIIFGAAGTSSASYQALVEHSLNMQVYCVELPGRGERGEEPLETDFEKLSAKIFPDVMEWTKNRPRFFIWGDSLGAVLAYEVAKRLQERGAETDTTKNPPQLLGTGLLGLIVSGNAGPTVAALEQGMGANTSKCLGWDCKSVSQMTLKDWKNFYIASSGQADTKQLEEALADDELAEQALKPLIADCTVYESYDKCEGVRIRDPIYTIRGEHDLITSEAVMKSWELVAGGRVEHIQIAQSGHMLVKDSARKLAQHISNICLPDFSAGLHNYDLYRAMYHSRWATPKLPKLGSSSMLSMLSSPGISPSKSPSVANMMDFDLDVLTTPLMGPTKGPMDNAAFELDVLADSETIIFPTKGVQEMRFGNMSWRLPSKDADALASRRSAKDISQ